MTYLPTGLICACLFGVAPAAGANALQLVDAAAIEAPRDDVFADYAAVERLYFETLAADGIIAPLFEELDHRIELDDLSRDRWMAAELAWKHGDLERAATLYEALCEADDAPALGHLRRVELLDARGRARDALDGYRALLDSDRVGLDPAILRLRIALLETELGNGAGAAPREPGEPSALATYARETEDPELCRRSALALASQGKFAEAAELYVAVGEDTARFRQEVRLAEWALSADNFESARTHAWLAVREAGLRRDRRYALGVLVEAHRADKSLKSLIELFAETPDLDQQSREVWIDLLRETGEIDEALRLFRESAEGSFTPTMRRELLEICRESGREEILVDAYRELLVTEPEILEWREGYARYELERGRRDAAALLWTDWVPDAPLDLLLEGAERMRALGLDREALDAVERSIAEHGPASAQAEAGYLFLFDLHLDRGRPELAEAALTRHDAAAPPDAPGRLQLAESFERLGDTRRAVDVMEGVRAARGPERSGEDLEMRLAWLYSEVGEEELALERWRELWPQVASVPRRRYVEDRMMTVAARLGVLAEIAIELEEKLLAGEADDKDAGLLVRLYTRVGDAVSAAEIIDEYMQRSGGDLREALAEKSRVYLACRDYYNYEATVSELIELDPENESDYLRQLAMSQLERGAYDEAHEALERLKQIDGASDGAEFEAGVLALAGMRDDAERAYRKGIARHPERIDVYLLLANVLRDLGRTEIAIGMFQHLAATAEADDLFTISIDGLLNMEAPPATLRWARRVTLERLTAKHDRSYLYQLLADLSEELGDLDGRLRALEGQLSIVGERRGSTLRELMDLAGSKRRRDEHLAYGRRLLALGDLVPPQVYLDLGQAFLESGQVTNAARTFGLATDLPDYGAFQRLVGEKFEQARFLDHALRVNERALLGAPTDVALMMKVGELHERLGHRESAVELYDRCVEILLARRPLRDGKAEEQTDDDDPLSYWSGNRNVDAYDQHFSSVRQSLLATATDEQLFEGSWDRERDLLYADLERLAAEGTDVPLDAHPRVRDRAAFLRHTALAAGTPERVTELDQDLLRRYPSDERLLASLVDERVRWGFIADARALIDLAERPEAQKRDLASAFGEGEARGALSPTAATRGVLSRIARGDREGLLRHLQSVDLSGSSKEDLDALPLLHGAAAYLGDSELVLAFGRQWMVLAMNNASGWQGSSMIQTMLGRSRRVLDDDQRRSLIGQLVDRVTSNPEDADAVLRLLPELEGWVDGPLLDAETALALIEEKASSQFYGVMPLFALVAAEDLPGCVRSLWPKVAESQRAWFLIQFVQELDRVVSTEFQDFLVGAFQESLSDSDMADFLGYLISDLSESDNMNPELVLRLTVVGQERNPKDAQLRLAYARALQRAGRDEEGLAYALEVFEDLIDDASGDWQVRNSIEELPAPYLPERAEEFLAACDRALEAGGSAEQILPRRFVLLRQMKDDDRYFAELQAAVTEHPDVEVLRDRYVALLRERGQRHDAVRLLESRFFEDVDDDDLRNDVRRAWGALQNPEQELATLRESRADEEDGDEDEVDVQEEDRNPVPTSKDLVAAHAAGDDERTADLLHSLWRGWGGRSSQMHGSVMVISGGSVIFGGRRGSMYQVDWPAEVDDDQTEEAVVDPLLEQGGLIAWNRRAELALDEAAEAAEAEAAADEAEPRENNAWVVLAGDPVAQAEMQLARRTLTPRQFDQATEFVRGLARAEELDGGAGEAVRELLERTAAGRAGKLDHAMLLTLFEEDPEAVGSEARAFLDEFCATLNPLDGGQLRRLARVALAVGDPDRARRLYLWCATLAGSSSFGSSSGSIDTRSLLDEVCKKLEGPDRIEVIEAVLAVEEPVFDPYGWGRGNYDDLVISTWSRVLSPAEVLEYAGTAVDRATQTQSGIQRSLARTVGVLLARTGDASRSVEVLEYALCKFEQEDVSFESERAQWLSYTLAPGSLRSEDLRDLFTDPETWKDAVPDPATAQAAWVKEMSAAVLEWDLADRLSENSKRSLIALLAVHSHAAGDVQTAVALRDRIAEGAGHDTSALTWLMDVDRALGNAALADELEAQLLQEGRLDLGRWVSALRRIDATLGREAALERARELASFGRPQGLLELLIEWTADAERSEWESALVAREAAVAELERIDEAERLKREAARALR
jgi:hypothetical protein